MVAHKTVSLLAGSFLFFFVMGGNAHATTGGCATESTLFAVEYLGSCGYEQTDDFTLTADSYVTKIRIWYDSTRSPNGISATLTGPNSLNTSQVTTLGDCYAGWCEGNFIVNGTLSAGTYTITTSDATVCSNPSGASTLVVYGCSAAQNATVDDCIFNWIEDNFPQVVAPPDSQSNASGTLYYRWYAQTQSYLATESSTAHLYYLGPLSGGAVLDLGAITTWQTYANCTGGAGGDGAEEEIGNYIDLVFGLATNTLNGGLAGQLTPILSALTGGSSTCPTVTHNVNLSGGLSNLPNPMLATVNYGNGCTSTTGDQMAGSASLTVSNFTMSNSLISGDITLNISNIRQNGQAIADGTVSGNISYRLTTPATGSGTLLLTNFLTTTGSRINGTIDLGMAASAITIGLDISSSNEVDADLNLTVTSNGDRYVINTTTPGTVNQYTVTVSNVVFDAAQCNTYPISGTTTFSQGAEQWTVTFNGNCDGSYSIQ